MKEKRNENNNYKICVNGKSDELKGLLKCLIETGDDHLLNIESIQDSLENFKNLHSYSSIDLNVRERVYFKKDKLMLMGNPPNEFNYMIIESHYNRAKKLYDENKII